MRILLIEDEEVLANVLLQSLTKQNYVVDLAEDGEMGWEYTQVTNYSLILLDVGLPKLDGIRLCQRLRDSGCHTPILLMTAKDATSDRIRGLDAGADDYLIKPLDLGELQARIRALLRRGDAPRTPVLEMGGLCLDPRSCEVTYNQKLLQLTPKEYSLLELFLRNPARVFSRGDMIEHLWTFDDPPQEETVKSHIKGLRQKLKAVGAVDWIENVYGLGYRLNSAKITKQETQTSISPLPDADVQQQFNQALGKLWHQYQGLMLQRLEVLQQVSQAISDNQLTAELRQSGEKEAHKLAGVLGMFDQETGTEIARQIEQILSKNGDLLPKEKRELLQLIAELAQLLDVMVEKASNQAVTPITPEINPRLLLIDPDLQLASQLQQLAQPLGMGWQQMAKLEDVNQFLQTTSPDLVVLNLDEITLRSESLAFLSNLAKRTPPVPVLVLGTVDSLEDRVTVARCGARGFLVKPVTVAKIWQTALQILEQTRKLTVNILLVDDDPLVLAALPLMLEPWGMRVTTLADPLRFWDVLHSVAPDLLILDVDMPKISGIELCQAVRTDPQWQNLPIVFLTSHREIEIVQQVFAAGADDYVVKPVVGAELLARITHRLERNRLWQSLSTKDPVTGLANQSHSSRELQLLMTQVERFCLVLFRVRELHKINIQYGHEAGMQVLQRWSLWCESTFRSGEVMGYWGHGEFVVGISTLTKAEVSAHLSDLFTTLGQEIFTAPNGDDRFAAICDWAVVEYPHDALTIQSLYQTANRSLHRDGV
jgi:diguanylate cyclase (GGDEF)-like protein